MKGDLVLKATSVFRGDVEIEGTDKKAYHKRNDAEDIMVCLTCTREKCFGEIKCFNKRKKEMKEGG